MTNVKALDRGLKVLAALADADKACTVSEIASAIDITRTAARRFILTLEHAGYVRAQGSGYVLQARVLELGDTYLQGEPLAQISRPYLEELAETAAETVSLTVLHRGFVTYIDRVHASRLLAINIVVGSRVPAYATATGRVLLSQLDEVALGKYFDDLHTSSRTDSITTDIATIQSTVLEARNQGWFLADQQLRSGIRSLAVPVGGGPDPLPAAVNIAASAARINAGNLKRKYLVPLLNTAERISTRVAEASGGHATL